MIATAHARADKDYSEALIPYAIENQVLEAIKDKRQGLHNAMRAAAFDYAEQVQLDYDSFKSRLTPQDCPASD